MEESRPLLLDRLFLSKIFIFKLKLLVQKSVTVFQIYRFLYLLYMGDVISTIASLPIFVQNIYIFKLKLLVQKLGTLVVTVCQIYRFLYLLYMGGATSTIASLLSFVQNIYIETVVTCTKFEVSYCYRFPKIPILLLAYNSK